MRRLSARFRRACRRYRNRRRSHCRRCRPRPCIRPTCSNTANTAAAAGPASVWRCADRHASVDDRSHVVTADGCCSIRKLLPLIDSGSMGSLNVTRATTLTPTPVVVVLRAGRRDGWRDEVGSGSGRERARECPGHHIAGGVTYAAHRDGEVPIRGQQAVRPEREDSARCQTAFASRRPRCRRWSAAARCRGSAPGSIR